MKFIQHIPNFVDTSTPPYEIKFDKLEDLLSDPRIQRWKKFDKHKFVEFKVNRHHSYSSLMAYYDNHEFWWCLGRIENED